MFEEFINYLKYIGFITESTFQNFASELNSISESDNTMKNPKLKIITTMINYIKGLSEEKIIGIMTNIYERYLEHKQKISSNKLLNLMKIYKNKEIKFYMIYWNKLSQYLMHKDIQRESINTMNNFIPNNLSAIKVRNSDIHTITNNNDNLQNINISITKQNNIITNDFIERQEKYMLKKQKNLMKNIGNNEEEFQLLYTFKPCIDKSMKNYNGKIKRNKNNNLYNNKIHDMKMKNLREAIDNERGYTFKPRINSYKNINRVKKNK